MTVGPLLDGRFLPVTAVAGFVDAPLDRCVDAVVEAAAMRLLVDPGAADRQPVHGDIPLAAALDELCDRPDHTTGYLLAPTDGGRWTAMFEDAAGPGVLGDLVADLPDTLGCRTASVYVVPGVEEVPGIVGFTLAEPGRAGMSDAVRVLIVERANGPPEVQSYGEPLAAEPPDPATLDLEALDRVLRSLGVRAFDESFYLPAGSEGLIVTIPRSVGR